MDFSWVVFYRTAAQNTTRIVFQIKSHSNETKYRFIFRKHLNFTFSSEILTKIKPELRKAPINRFLVVKMSFSPSGPLKTGVAPVLHSEHGGNRLTFGYRFEPHDEAAAPLPLRWSCPRTGGQMSCRRRSWTVSRPWHDLLLAPSGSI